MLSARFHVCWFLLSSLALASSGRAEVRMPAVLADHMVVQRDRPTHWWGDADPGEMVTVSFRDESRTVKTDELGRWSVYLPAGDAGGPFEVTVEGANKITLSDVLVGDVWLASGQSNMERPMRLAANPEQEIAAAKHPQLRFFQVLPRVSDYPRERLDTKEVRPWVPCEPKYAAEFSAVAYYFAREIQARTNVPVGIVQSFWGGTPAEAWTSLRTLASDPALLPVFQLRAQIAAQQTTIQRQLLEAQRAYDRAVAAGKAEGLTDPSWEWHPDFGGWGPAALFNGMIAPLTPLPIKGVIWYQGESNTEPLQYPIYGRLFRALIGDWRRAWAEGDFPFLYVQIANFGGLPPGSHWPEVREAQRRTLQVANTAMAVTIDIGETEDIHPKNKRDVGHRLALAARALAYGDAIEYSGPLFRQAVPEDGSLRVWFDHAADGLVIHGPELTGFEVAGTDGNFVAATATIDGDAVLVSSPEVPAPRYVRYGWAANPACNLYNGAGLPASPFTSQE